MARSKTLQQHAINSSNFSDYLRRVSNDGYDVNDRGEADQIFSVWAQREGPSRGNQPNNNDTKSFSNILSAFRSNAQFTSIEQENIKVDKFVESFMGIIKQPKKVNIFTQPSEIIKQLIQSSFIELVNQLEIYYREQSALRTAINKDAGLNFQFAESYRKTLTDASPKLLQYGISFKDLAETSVALVKNTGRFYTLNETSIIRAAQVSGAYMDSMYDMTTLLPAFEKIGIGATEAMESIARAGKDSISLGLRAQNVTKQVGANIDKLNQYGFKNGVDGLTKMVQKSIEFRMSMEEVYKIADKVMSPEGAIELSANLQVLGGAIGAFNDPMQLMYMATNNVEGLQDALIQASSNLATYNQEQQRFEITGVNLRYAKQMAADLGVTYNDLAQGAIAAAEKSSAASDLLRAGLILDDEDKEFITNISKMKDGKMVIDVSNSTKLQEFFGGTSVALENLDQAQVEMIKQYRSQLTKKTEEEIIFNQYTSITNIENSVNSIAARLRTTAGRGLENIVMDKGMRKLMETFGMEIDENRPVTEEITSKLTSLVNSLNDKQLRYYELDKEVINRFKKEIESYEDALGLKKESSTETKPVTPQKQSTPTKIEPKKEGENAYDKFKDNISNNISIMTGLINSAFGKISDAYNSMSDRLFSVNKDSKNHLSSIDGNIKTLVDKSNTNVTAKVNSKNSSSPIVTTENDDLAKLVSYLSYEDYTIYTYLKEISNSFKSYAENTSYKTSEIKETKPKKEKAELFFDKGYKAPVQKRKVNDENVDKKNNEETITGPFKNVSNIESNSDKTIQPPKIEQNLLTKNITEILNNISSLNTEGNSSLKSLYDLSKESNNILSNIQKNTLPKIDTDKTLLRQDTLVTEKIVSQPNTPQTDLISNLFPIIQNIRDDISDILNSNILSEGKLYDINNQMDLSIKNNEKNNIVISQPNVIEYNKIGNQIFTQLVDVMSKPNPTEKTDKTITVRHIHEHQHIVKSPAMEDALARYITRFPNFFRESQSMDERSYTNTEIIT